MSAPLPRREPEPAARGAYLEMVGAVIAGEGLERVAEIAGSRAGAPVAVVVPRLGCALEEWQPYVRYVAARLSGRPAAPRPREVTAELPIVSGAEEVGAVLLLGGGAAQAGELLQAAALAALTELAIADAREETEQRLGSSLLEEVLSRRGLPTDELVRRAARLGCDLSGGLVALCADPRERAPGRVVAALSAELPGSLAQPVGGRVFALVPGREVEEVRDRVARLARHATVGISTRYSDATSARRALEEAQLIVDVKHRGSALDGAEIGDGTYRLLFRVLASRPEEIRSFYEDTIAPIVRYDAQYGTDLVGTLSAYLDRDCSVSAAAGAVFAHRHTVGYRLERIAELTGLDPGRSEDRERLGLGLKAYRIIEPTLPR